MPIIILIAAAAFAAVALSGLDPALARSASILMAAGIVAAALASRRTRVTFNRGAGLYFPALASLAALAAAGAIGGGQMWDGAPFDPIGAARAAAPIVSAGLAGWAIYAAAFALGRTELAVGFMAIPPLVAALLFGFGAADPALTSPYGASVGLLALLALFTVADEVRRRPALGAPPPAPLPRRLLAPAACLIAAFALIVWQGALAALAALAAGVLAFVLAHLVRARKSRLGMAVAPIVLGAALLGLLLGGGAAAVGGGFQRLMDAAPRLAEAAQATEAEFLRLPLFGGGAAPAGAATAAAVLHQIGLAGVAAFLALAATLLIALSAMKDGGRRPSRGFALAFGVVAFTAVSALLSADFSAPASGLMLAATLGLAASFRDQRRPARNRDAAAPR